MAMERRSVLYEGRVQGVGFRFTASRLASGFAVSGFVRNLADGRVQLEAQGDPDRVGGFLTAILESLGTKIHRAIVSPIPLEPDEAAGDFLILD